MLTSGRLNKMSNMRILATHIVSGFHLLLSTSAESWPHQELLEWIRLFKMALLNRHTIYPAQLHLPGSRNSHSAQILFPSWHYMLV